MTRLTVLLTATLARLILIRLIRFDIGTFMALITGMLYMVDMANVVTTGAFRSTALSLLAHPDVTLLSYKFSFLHVAGEFADEGTIVKMYTVPWSVMDGLELLIPV